MQKVLSNNADLQVACVMHLQMVAIYHCQKYRGGTMFPLTEFKFGDVKAKGRLWDGTSPLRSLAFEATVVKSTIPLKDSLYDTSEDGGSQSSAKTQARMQQKLGSATSEEEWWSHWQKVRGAAKARV